LFYQLYTKAYSRQAKICSQLAKVNVRIEKHQPHSGAGH